MQHAFAYENLLLICGKVLRGGIYKSFEDHIYAPKIVSVVLL